MNHKFGKKAKKKNINKSTERRKSGNAKRGM